MTTSVAYRNGLGTSALVIGIIGLALSWIPIINYIALVLGAIGVVLGLLALVKVRQGGANNPIAATIGLVLSAVAIVASIVAFISFANAVEEGVDDLNRDLKQYEQEMDRHVEDLQKETDCMYSDDPNC